jgi:hypothetical protein
MGKGPIAAGLRFRSREGRLGSIHDAMPRLYFESPDHVDPDDHTTERLRRLGVATWKVLLVGGVAIASTMTTAFVQRVWSQQPVEVQYESAQTQSARSGRPILLVFADSAAPASQRMDAETWSDDALREIAARKFVLLRVEPWMARYDELAERYGVTTPPCFVVTWHSGEVVKADGREIRHAGHASAAETQAILQRVWRPAVTDRSKLGRLDRPSPPSSEGG